MREGPKAASPVVVQPMFATADCDLALLIENACETLVADHFFDNFPENPDGEQHGDQHKSGSASRSNERGTTQDAKVILDLAPRPSWAIETRGEQ